VVFKLLRDSMPTQGAYAFKLAPKAVDHQIPTDHLEYIEPGEWAWIKLDDQGLCLFNRCPDCHHLATLWQNGKGHTIDLEGNISPSVLHSVLWGDPPKQICGFHTQPTKLLGFKDLRSSGS
jgi:hypothetical protein